MQNFFELFADAARRHAARTRHRGPAARRLDQTDLRPPSRDGGAHGRLARDDRHRRPAIAARSSPTTTRHWCAAYLGILRRGAVAVPLDTAYKAAQVETLLRDSGARVMFTTAKYLDTVTIAARDRGRGLPHRAAARRATPGSRRASRPWSAGDMPAPPLPACPARQRIPR